MRFLNYISLQGNELRDAVHQVLATVPTEFHAKGRVYFDSRIDDWNPNLLYAPYPRLRFNATGGSGENDYRRVAIIEDLYLLEGRVSNAGSIALSGKLDRALTKDYIFIGETVTETLNGSVVTHDVAVGRPTTNLTLNAWSPPSANVDWNAKRLVNLQDPLNAQDAVTKGYADALRTGLLVKEACDMATAGPLPAHTVNAPTSQFGSMTATAVGPLVVDGVAVQLLDRILVKDEPSGLGPRLGAAMNGIYQVTNTGSAYAAWTLTRSDDADASGDSMSVVSQGISTSILLGNLNRATQWTLYTQNPIILNSTDQDWRLTYQTQDLTAGAGLIANGTIWDVDLYVPTLPVLGLYGAGTAAQLGIKNTDNSAVVGQANSAAVPGWLKATIDGTYLKRIGGSLAFGSLLWADIPDRPGWLNPGTLAGYSVLGNPNGTTATPTAITGAQVAITSQRLVLSPGYTTDIDPKLKFQALGFRDLPDGAAKSVFGRSANSVGVMASIAANAVNDVLMLAADSTVKFQPFLWGMIPDRPGWLNPGTLAGYSVLGNPNTATSTPTAITGIQVLTTAPRQMLSPGYTTDIDPKLKFQTLVLRDLPDAAAASVLGRSAATTGVYADIPSTADKQYLKRTGTTLSFSAIPFGDLPAPLDGTLTEYSVVGRNSAGTGNPAAISVGTLPAAGAQRKMFLADNVNLKWTELAFRDLPDGASKSVLGRSANSPGVLASISGNAVGDVMQIASDLTVKFQPIDYSIILNRLRKFTFLVLGNGVTNPVPVVHNLLTNDVIVEVYEPDVSPYERVYMDVEHFDSNTVNLRFGTVPANGKKYQVVVIG